MQATSGKQRNRAAEKLPGPERRNMEILIIDGQGGGIGKQTVTAVKKAFPNIHVTAVGTNGTAADAMRKAGADDAAAGENAVIVSARKADVIIGPIGMVIADSMCGEISPAMALAISQSKAKRIMIPVNRCDNVIVGVADLSIGKLIANVVEVLTKLNSTGC
jgi:hypothetical protein